MGKKIRISDKKLLEIGVCVVIGGRPLFREAELRKEQEI